MKTVYLFALLCFQVVSCSNDPTKKRKRAYSTQNITNTFTEAASSSAQSSQLSVLYQKASLNDLLFVDEDPLVLWNPANAYAAADLEEVVYPDTSNTAHTDEYIGIASSPLRQIPSGTAASRDTLNRFFSSPENCNNNHGSSSSTTQAALFPTTLLQNSVPNSPNETVTSTTSSAMSSYIRKRAWAPRPHGIVGIYSDTDVVSELGETSSTRYQSGGDSEFSDEDDQEHENGHIQDHGDKP